MPVAQLSLIVAFFCSSVLFRSGSLGAFLRLLLLHFFKFLFFHCFFRLVHFIFALRHFHHLLLKNDFLNCQWRTCFFNQLNVRKRGSGCGTLLRGFSIPGSRWKHIRRCDCLSPTFSLVRCNRDFLRFSQRLARHCYCQNAVFDVRAKFRRVNIVRQCEAS